MAGGWAGDKREVKADRQRKPCNCGAMSNLGIYVRPTNKCACVFCKTSDIPGHQADQTNLTGLGWGWAQICSMLGCVWACKVMHFSLTGQYHPREEDLKTNTNWKVYISLVWKQPAVCWSVVVTSDHLESTLPRPNVPQKTILQSDHFSHCFRYIQQINWTFSLPKIRLAGRQIDGMFWVRL